MRRSVAQRVETDYKQALTREEMLGKAVNQTKAEYDQLNARSFEYQQLKRDADTNKALYSDLERRIKEAGINAGFQNSSIRISDPARPPDAPVYPRKTLYLILAFLLSVVAVCAAVLADVLDKTIRDPKAADALDTSVLGTLPAVKGMRRLLNPVAPTLAAKAASARMAVECRCSDSPPECPNKLNRQRCFAGRSANTCFTRQAASTKEFL